MHVNPEMVVLVPEDISDSDLDQIRRASELNPVVLERGLFDKVVGFIRDPSEAVILERPDRAR